MEKITFNQDLRSKKEDVIQDLRSYEIKEVVEKIGLTNERFIPYHCKAVKQIGLNKYCQLADMASKGKNPLTLMSYLLKEELGRDQVKS